MTASCCKSGPPFRGSSESVLGTFGLVWGPAVESSAECRRSWAQSAALHCVRNSIRDETVPCRAEREDLARDLKDYETDALATAPFPRGVIGGTSGQYVHGACSCS